MTRYRLVQSFGVLLVIGGCARLVLSFKATIGTVVTNCGNAVAYLDGQDKKSAYSETLAACSKSLRDASYEGIAAAVLGLVALILGMSLGHRYKVRRRAFRVREAALAGAGSPGGTDPAVFEQFMRLGRLTRPKTVLGFFGAIFVALVAGSVVAIMLFLKHPNLEKYIPWILGFDGLVTVMLVIGVLVTITKDPARLMLSEITSQNALALRRRSSDAGDAREPSQIRQVVTEETQTSDAAMRRRWDDPRR
jgi:lysylphosphatidylglycerol synthetase-like protein (DUF2156 family)